MKIKRFKKKYYIIITTFLIFFLLIIFLLVYTDKTKNKINLIAQDYFEREVDNNLHNLVKNISNNESLDILTIYKNKNEEILYVDYNLNKSYQLLDKLSDKIKKGFDGSNDLNNKMIIKIPFMVYSNNSIFSNFGPKITIKVNYIDSILANLYTKVTNYGLNNALVEAYIKFNISGRIISPVSDKKITSDYDILISSKIINGRVPDIYGNHLTSNSSLFDIPISK